MYELVLSYKDGETKMKCEKTMKKYDMYLHLNI